jgi:hypothetical protein
MRRFRGLGYVTPRKGHSSKPSNARCVAYRALLGLVGGSIALLMVFFCLMSIVYASSVDLQTFDSRVTIREGNGARQCLYDLCFTNASVARDLTICAEYRGLDGARSGDILVFEERVGPLGSRLTAMRRTRSR